MARIAIEKPDLTSWGIPRKYAQRIKGAGIISPSGQPAEIVEEKAPKNCPQPGCGLRMRYEDMGCDGDFCWGFCFCPNPDHQGRVWQIVIGPH